MCYGACRSSQQDIAGLERLTRIVLHCHSFPLLFFPTKLSTCWLYCQCCLTPCPPCVQAPNAAYEADAERLLTIMRSFQCREVEV